MPLCWLVNIHACICVVCVPVEARAQWDLWITVSGGERCFSADSRGRRENQRVTIINVLSVWDLMLGLFCHCLEIFVQWVQAPANPCNPSVDTSRYRKWMDGYEGVNCSSGSLLLSKQFALFWIFVRWFCMYLSPLQYLPTWLILMKPPVFY